MSRVSDVFRAFRHRNYRLFFTGQAISLIGTWMQTVAQSWLVYRMTDSAVLLGANGFASQIPVFLMAPIGGLVADRFSRHRILLITQSMSMLISGTLAVLTLTGRVSVPIVFVTAALLGIINGFDIPARQSFVVQMVGREDLPNAIALNSSMFNGARILGPAIAGILVAAVGEGWCFAINSLSYLAVLGGLAAMTVALPQRHAQRKSPIAQIVEGFRFAAGTAPIRALMLFLGLVSFMGMPYSVLMPVFADRILDTGASGLGILLGSAGIGAFAGSIVLASRPGVRGLGRWIAISGGSFGVLLIAFAASRNFVLSCAILLGIGCSMILQMASSNTLIQAMVPDELRGRVMSIYSMMFMGMAPLGSLTAGALADAFGAPITVTLGGLCCIAGAAVFGMKLPLLRGEARMLLSQQMMAGAPSSAAAMGEGSNRDD